MGLRILVDENDDGLAKWLREKGYEVESVLELKEKDGRMGNDYNVIKHAQENGMVVITHDTGVIAACRDNGVNCVAVDKGVIRRYVLNEIVKLEGGAR